MSQRGHLISLLERLQSAVVGCAGDIMLDRFVYGSVSRISPEAPIPVLHIETQQLMLGGLGNVVRNLRALGCGVRLFSVTGEDSAGAEVKALVNEVPGCQAYLLGESSRRTPVKVRYVAHGQQLLRADDETADIVEPSVFNALLVQFAKHVAECSIVFLSDYAKGVLKGSNAQEFIRLARAARKPVVVDPKGRDFARYRSATVIKPNLKELAEATGINPVDPVSQERAARELLDLTDAQFILLTRGAAGMLLVPRDQPPTEFSSLAREVYDVSGAGDTVAAVLAAALGSGAGILEAVELANIAAGIAVGKVGTAVVERTEIVDEIEKDLAVTASEKILRLPQAMERIRAWRRAGRRVGLAQASFDPLSIENLKALEEARSQCDRLLVGLTAEASPPGDRSTEERAFLLASLANVDGVVVFDSSSAANDMDTLRAEASSSKVKSSTTAKSSSTEILHP